MSMYDVNSSAGLLIDTNLLVLYTVGSVNPDRIENFKRTQKYIRSDFDLLRQVMAQFHRLYTVAHVMAEVSNLTDLPGVERQKARDVLKEALAVLEEPVMASARAAQEPSYARLGLADAAIGAIAREHQCAVLTDDLDLYMALSDAGMVAWNFTHLRAQAWGV